MSAPAAAPGRPRAGGRAVPGLRERLLPPPMPLTRWHWIVPLAVTLLAGLLRFTRLDHPDRLVFDETYYPKDAYSLLLSGYERQWPDDVDEAFARGEAQPKDEAAYVVHPPLGKWLISLGILLFGPDNGYGWRFPSAVAGTLSVLLVCVIAQHLFRSPALGGSAGLLLAIEGHHLVMSRTGLLDIFLSFFVLAAFGALLVDRHRSRLLLVRRMAAADDDGSHRAVGPLGPGLGLRPWRLLAGLLLGAACAVKLSGLAFMAVFGLMTVLWDLQARRTAGVRRWAVAGVVRDGIPAFFAVVGGGLVTYLASWTGWFVTRGGYYRTWAEENPAEGRLESLLPDPLRSLVHYHLESTRFHTGLGSPHDYASSPWTWPFMGRPVSFYYEGTDAGQDGCVHADGCSAAITDLAHPLIWWSGLIAVVVCVFIWLGQRDWRAGALLGTYLAGQIVWFLWPERTMFFFYTVAYEPFMILMIVLALSLLLRPGGRIRPRTGALLLLGYLAVMVAVAVFFLPVWVGETIPYPQWRMRMWLSSWI